MLAAARKPMPSDDPNLAPANNARLRAALLLNFVVLAVLLNSVGAVALHVQRSFGVSQAAAGLLAVCKSLGIAAASFAAALQLARFGYRRTMLVALGALTLVCLVVPSVPDFAMLKLLFAVAGAGFALIKVSVYASVGLLTTDRKGHASLMSFLESGFTLGVVGGSFLFSAFIDEARPSSTEWLKVFYVVAALSALAGLLLLGVPLDESRVRGGPADTWQDRLRAMGGLTLQRIVLTFCGCVFCYVVVDQSIINWLPTFNSKVFQLPTWLSIQMASLLTISMVIGRVTAGFALRRFAWFPVLAFCLVMAAVFVALGLSLARGQTSVPVTGWLDAPPSVAVFPLIGFFVAPIFPVINSIMLSSVPVSRHAAMSGLGVIFSAAGSALGTLALGYLFQAHGGRNAFYFTLIPLAVLLAGLALFNRQTRAVVVAPSP